MNRQFYPMFPNNKTLSYPLCFIGIIMVILGIRWLIHPEPWMLDEVANVERLGMTFEELFDAEINKTLPDYLTQIYRFFGFWVLIVGALILNLSRPDIIYNNKKISTIIIYTVGLMMIFGLYLGYSLIPSSHFISLIWVFFIFYLISLYSYFKLKDL